MYVCITWNTIHYIAVHHRTLHYTDYSILHYVTLHYTTLHHIQYIYVCVYAYTKNIYHNIYVYIYIYIHTHKPRVYNYKYDGLKLHPASNQKDAAWTCALCTSQTHPIVSQVFMFRPLDNWHWWRYFLAAIRAILQSRVVLLPPWMRAWHTQDITCRYGSPCKV